MKWIGAHIWDWITRFRNDVYLEKVVDAGTDTDKFLVADTNGKVGYRTGAETLSDIGAASTAYVDGQTHLQLGTTSSTALAGDTTTISTGQAAEITANTAKVSNIVQTTITGNAGTASQLQNTVTIGGVDFNGQNDVDLPGVNETGDQDTSGNAATATKIASITNTDIVQLAGAQTLSGVKTFSSSIVSPGITTASNGNILIDPDGTGSITLKSDDIIFEGAGTVTLPSLKLSEATLLEGNYVGFKPPLSITANQLWTLPDGDGTANQVLKTNGLGILDWGTYLTASNPTTTGVVSVKPVHAASPGKIAFYEASDTNLVTIQAHDSLAADYSLYLPTADGSADQVLKTDGSGNLGWATASGSNLGSTDLTLSAERKLTLDGNNLIIENAAGTEVAKIFSTGYFQNKSRLLVNGGTTSAAFLKLHEATDNGTNSISLKAPTTISSDVSLTLPDADGTSGQALVTDGGGNLSFSTVSGGSSSNSTLIVYGGRVQHSTSFDNRMIICGGIYGPTYYIWSSAAGVTASSGGTVDTTTFTLPGSYQHYGSIIVPSTGQVKVDFLAKPLNGNSYSKPYVMQLWEFTPTIGTTSGPTCTLRAKVDMTSSSSASYASATMTSTSDITAGKYVFVTIGMDAQTLTSTAYQYMNVNVTLLA